MSNECDKCGQDDAGCHCFLLELDKRLFDVEEGLDQLTEIVQSMSEFIKRNVDER